MPCHPELQKRSRREKAPQRMASVRPDPQVPAGARPIGERVHEAGNETAECPYTAMQISIFSHQVSKAKHIVGQIQPKNHQNFGLKRYFW